MRKGCLLHRSGRRWKQPHDLQMLVAVRSWGATRSRLDYNLIRRESAQIPPSRHQPRLEYPRMQHSASTPVSSASSPTHHYISRASTSQTTSPYLSPPFGGFTLPQYLGVARRRLLIPTVRRSGDANSPKPSSRPVSRVMRSTSGSTSHHSSPDPGATPRPLTWAGKEWIGVDCKFEIVEEFELEGYQIYAVEKWCVVLRVLPMP